MKHNGGACLKKHKEHWRRDRNSKPHWCFTSPFPSAVYERKRQQQPSQSRGDQLSCSECRGQWAADNIPCPTNHLLPIRLYNTHQQKNVPLCNRHPPPHKRESKLRQEVEGWCDIRTVCTHCPSNGITLFPCLFKSKIKCDCNDRSMFLG